MTTDIKPGDKVRSPTNSGELLVIAVCNAHVWVKSTRRDDAAPFTLTIGTVKKVEPRFEAGKSYTTREFSNETTYDCIRVDHDEALLIGKNYGRNTAKWLAHRFASAYKEAGC
jgi:hypothetical protein